MNAFLHFCVFQYHCFLIFWSHFKCMTTEPGLLPKEVEELEFAELPVRTRSIFIHIAERIKGLETDIRKDYEQ